MGHTSDQPGLSGLHVSRLLKATEVKVLRWMTMVMVPSLMTEVKVLRWMTKVNFLSWMTEVKVLRWMTEVKVLGELLRYWC